MAKVVGKSKEHVFKATCRQCASKIEYTRSETKAVQHTDYGGGTDTYYWLKCPGCGASINTGSD